MADKERHKKLLELARKRLVTAQAALAGSRELELNDLKFVAGSPDNMWQWPEDVQESRKSQGEGMPAARPCLTINKLPQHVKQVTNDQKENRPAGKVIPVNDKADKDLAEVYSGILRHIEYISDADVAYDTACESQVISGEGYIRLLTEYIDSETFDQEIKIGRIRNAFSVFLDPTIQDPCGADAGWGFITTDMRREEFDAAYPDAEFPLSSVPQSGVGDQDFGDWLNEDTIRVAEYFYVESEFKTLYMFEEAGIAEEDSFIADEALAAGIPYKERRAEKKIVKWAKINGYEVLEEGTWPGSFIPIIRVIGNEFEIEGELHISGLIRNSKDPQRMYNYWSSQEAEMLALAPKVPFIGYAGQFEGFENKWNTANTVPWAYLEVNEDAADANGSPLPLPQRSQPAQVQSGLIAAKQAAADDIKATTGQYDSAMGQTSNERSGKAILARERQSDTGTYHYVDNLARAVRYLSRQIIELIPIIYDTKRVVRIMGLDGKPSSAEIDPQQPEAKKDIMDPQGTIIKSIYNPGVGKYDICVTTGPGYTTKRQESAEGMANMVQGNPELWSIIGDLLVESFDWPGSSAIAERIKRSIDPKLLEDGQSPELAQALEQIESMKQEGMEMAAMIKNISNSIEVQEIKIKEYDAETKRLNVVQTGMTPEQVKDTVEGAIDGIVDSGALGSPTGVSNSNPTELPTNK